MYKKLAYSSDDDKVLQKKLLRNRLFFAMAFTLLLFSLLIARMAYLQWTNYSHYKGMADGNRISLETLPPTRGKIYDRNGILLADNQPIFVLKFDKKQIPNISKTKANLISFLPGLPSKTADKFFDRLTHFHNAKPIILPYTLSEKEAAVFAVQSHLFPGVNLTAQLKRTYPFKSSMAHALGYVGKINPRETAKLDKERYQATDVMGKNGVEKQYEDRLHGYPGFQEIETNARGRILRTLSTQPAIPGEDIHLTIDIKLQTYIENLLKDQKASVVVLEPQSGEVLAIVSNPSYDLNQFVGGISQTNYDRLLNNKKRPLINRATSGQYPPGSTIKPFVSLGALENGIITEKHSIFDPGYFVFKDHRYRDWKRSGHGRVNMSSAIEQSCDTYFYDLSLKMGINTIHDYLYPFGFGHKTGIDLPSEKEGILPSKEWKKSTKGVNWYKGETIIASIGQGYFLATPLQLAKSAAMIANRGKIIQPHLLKYKHIPELPHIPIKKNTHWENVIKAMAKVMHGTRGTARRYTRNIDFKMAGKTGTAQVFSLNEGEYHKADIRKGLHDHSLFLGFAPIQKPKLAIGVIIENADVKAAPISVKITNYYLTEILNTAGQDSEN